jgi:hypothetical protein
MTAVHFQTADFVFPPLKGGEQMQQMNLNFPSNVLNHSAAIRGYEIGYKGSDHHLLTQKIDVDTKLFGGTTVQVTVNYLLRDSSGEIDDPYEGKINVLVIAECVS